MFVHSVFFWLRDNLSDAELNQFVEGAQALTRLESVRYGFLGTPAETDRPVIDRSYSYALTAIFDDEAGHDEYQVHEVHDRFRDECASLWTRVLIYDSVTV